mgnify:CR=1 FL=1
MMMFRIVRGQGTEHRVDGMQEAAQVLGTSLLVTLDHLKKIVYENIVVVERLVVRTEDRSRVRASHRGPGGAGAATGCISRAVAVDRRSIVTTDPWGGNLA